MSSTKENVEIPLPKHEFIQEGVVYTVKLFLLAGARESTRETLCTFFESVVTLDELKVATRDLWSSRIQNLSKTGWLNYCEWSKLTESFNVKVIFVVPCNGNSRREASTEFRVLLAQIEHEQIYFEFDSAEYEDGWNFNLAERVREQAEDI